MYIHERDNWTKFQWRASELTALIEAVSRKQGLLYGRLASLGLDSKLKAMAENLTYDVIHSSEIEGICLNADEVRSSIARKPHSRRAHRLWHVWQREYYSKLATTKLIVNNCLLSDEP